MCAKRKNICELETIVLFFCSFLYNSSRVSGVLFCNILYQVQSSCRVDIDTRINSLSLHSYLCGERESRFVLTDACCASTIHAPSTTSCAVSFCSRCDTPVVCCCCCCAFSLSQLGNPFVSARRSVSMKLTSSSTAVTVKR